MLDINTIPKVITYNNPISMGLDEIRDFLEDYKKRYSVDLDPDFQRGHVWSQKNQIKFIEHILKGGRVPPILFNRFGREVVLVDGKQRLTAILEFLDNKLPVFGGNYLHDIIDYKRVLASIYFDVAFNGLDNRNDIIKWYLEINEGQVAHTLQELEQAKSFLT